jgi:hypothetical protein
MAKFEIVTIKRAFSRSAGRAIGPIDKIDCPMKQRLSLYMKNDYPLFDLSRIPPCVLPRAPARFLVKTNQQDYPH